MYTDVHGRILKAIYSTEGGCYVLVFDTVRNVEYYAGHRVAYVKINFNNSAENRILTNIYLVQKLLE